MSIEGASSEAALRRLVERLFLHRSYGNPAEEPRLLVGSLPPDWDLPLPRHAEVVGSHRQFAFHWQIALDVPGEPAKAVAELEQLLNGQGWRVQPKGWGPFRGGFMPAGLTPPAAAILMCDDRRRRHMDVTAAHGSGGVTELRINLNVDPTSFHPCEDDARMHDDVTMIFPALIPPPGMIQRGGGSGGGGSSVTTRTTLFGEPSPEAVEEHYRGQLLEAGWRVSSNGSSDRWAWGTWEFTDSRQNAWTALLSVVEPPGRENQREVFLQATMSGPAYGGGSWTTFGARRG